MRCNHYGDWDMTIAEQRRAMDDLEQSAFLAGWQAHDRIKCRLWEGLLVGSLGTAMLIVTLFYFHAVTGL